MNIVVVDIVYGIDFDADFIYANGFSHRALLDGQNEQIYVRCGQFSIFVSQKATHKKPTILSTHTVGARRQVENPTLRNACNLPENNNTVATQLHIELANLQINWDTHKSLTSLSLSNSSNKKNYAPSIRTRFMEWWWFA